MFTAESIQERVRVRPFRPFRIVTSASESFDVFHPDLVLVGNREITIGLPGGPNPTLYERLARITIMHVTALHDLPVPAPPPGNGQT